MEYQNNFTDNPLAREALYDREGRENRAEKVLAVLKDHFGDLSSLRLLDVSSSTGIMAAVFARHLKEVQGIDIDEKAVAFSRQNFGADNLSFRVMDALNTDYPENRFDIAVCNQMYEHVPDAFKLMQEIYRVLAPGGVCYFGATNRLNVMESHYGRLPFLSWLPKPLAHVYLRALGKGRFYYETHYTCWTLRRLVKDFRLIDYTLRVVDDPATFQAENLVGSRGGKQALARFILRHFYWFSPGYIWLLEKPR